MWWYVVRCCCLLFCLFSSEGVLSDECTLRIKRAELVPSNKMWVLNADIEYLFNHKIMEALIHGIPLTIAVTFHMEKKRSYWLDSTVSDLSKRFFIRYHPLTGFFQLSSEEEHVPHQFAGLSALLDTLGEIRGWKVFSIEQMRKRARYTAELSTSLEIEALPLPLRVLAYTSMEWRLCSSPFTWLVVP